MRLYLDSCVLIYALDGSEQLRRHTLQQLEGYGDSDWVISDLVRMECLVGPLRNASLHPAADGGCNPSGCCCALGLRLVADQPRTPSS